MEEAAADSSPDRFRLTVDEVVFDVAYDASQPGAYHYTRLTGPAAVFGFPRRGSDHARSTKPEHVDAIRTSLVVVDPTTGYLEDNLVDDGDTFDE